MIADSSTGVVTSMTWKSFENSIHRFRLHMLWKTCATNVVLVKIVKTIYSSIMEEVEVSFFFKTTVFSHFV